ncbi:unnamed protein product [Caretta caretta]
MTGLVLRELELRLVLSAYADDVLLVVQDPGDLARVEACQAIYSAASSARVNWVKSSGLAVGDWRQKDFGSSLHFINQATLCQYITDPEQDVQVTTGYFPECDFECDTTVMQRQYPLRACLGS